MDIPIIFEDNHLLVVEKPPNVLSQGDCTRDADLLTLLKQDLKLRYNKPGNVYLGLIHRLDRPVGGVMVFAKNSKAAARLAEQIREREFTRIYLAIIQGKPKEKGQLIHYLKKNSSTNIVSASNQATPGAKKAICDYQTINTAGDLSLVQIQLQTGRAHQIRVQFSAIGHPIINDYKYGTNIKGNSGRSIALWSYRIAFKHPTLRDDVSFSSLPDGHYPWNKFIGDRGNLFPSLR